MDHINKLTQIEDPREQWRREQERMLKEYLIVAQEALNAKKEIYQIKQQRFELAQEEYQQLHRLCEDDSRSHASSFSGYSANTKYDPYQIKAEIASRRDRVSRMKEELMPLLDQSIPASRALRASKAQDLVGKVRRRVRCRRLLLPIDRKMSSAHTSYKPDEAQAIMTELRTIKKAICTGEKERRDLMQSLAKLTDGFRNSFSLSDPPQDFPHNPGVLSDSLPQQFCDAGSQTDIIGEFVFDDKTRLVDRVRLNWQYEEARKRVSTIQQQLAQLENESWPGLAEADRDRLQLIKEKEALLQELQLIVQQRRPAEDVARLEAERRRLEEEIQRARATSVQGATERILLQEKRNCLLMQLEEATRLTSYLQSQLKSLSASSLTVSSGSSRGSLASSRGSLASSRGSLSSVSFTDIYGLPQYEKPDAECGQLLRFDLIPFDSLGRDAPFLDPPVPSGFHKQRRSLDTPQSLASLSSRSSLSSLSPPSSPLDTPFLPASRDSPLAQLGDGFEVPGLGTLDRLRAQASALGDEDLQGTASLQPHGFPGDGEGPRERGPQATVTPTAAMREKRCERCTVGFAGSARAPCLWAGLAGVQGCAREAERGAGARGAGRERSRWRESRATKGFHLNSELGPSGPPVGQEWREELGSESPLLRPSRHGAGFSPGPARRPGAARAGHCRRRKDSLRLRLRAAARASPSVRALSSVFGLDRTYCSKALEFQAPLVFNEIFRIPVHSSMLTLKSLQLYVCALTQQLQEELLGIAQINLADYDGSSEMQLRWYAVQVFSSCGPPRARESERLGAAAGDPTQAATAGKTDAVTALLARTTAQLQAVERELAEERVKLECAEDEILELGRKEELAEAVSERSWQADSVDSGCSSCAQTSPPHPEPCCVGGDPLHGHTFAGQADPYSPEKLQPPPLKVDKETNTEDVFLDEVASLPKERPGRRARGSPFVRSSTIVRSQTFSPGARSQYVCRLYRSDSDSSTLPRKSPFVRNTLERRTLRYKQPCRSSLAELMARTSLDLELDLQASRTRQRQLNEEICTLREMRQRLEDAQLRGQTDLPHWVLRDERFRSLLKEAERQTRQTKLDFHQEQAAEKMLKKASRGVCQLRGQNHQEPVQVQTFREKIAFFTRPRINVPPLPADDV
ncbi:protein WWC3 [Enhydra lutris kenyoni]|uniref:Protein WWC3 n=1 Tax=Enhydra lutris kenyoni TaxID=391180 RepID=A0A2Y9KJJ8_ENHLU|nr:protein WWC3 [Enhydra lutris kenyoni]